MSIDPAPDPSTRPRGVLIIASILTLEGISLVILAGGFVATILGGDPVSVGSSIFMTVLLVLVGLGLLALARQLMAAYRWPRSPSLVVQLFLVILAFPYFSSDNPLIGLVLMVPAAVVIVTLFSKPVMRFTVRTTANQKML